MNWGLGDIMIPVCITITKNWRFAFNTTNKLLIL